MDSSSPKERSIAVWVSGIIGGVVAVVGIARAVLWHDPYWYSYFTIGSFVLFDRISAALTGESTLRHLRTGKWHFVLLLYVAFVLGTLVVDVFYGRMFSQMWHYPHYGLRDEIIHAILIGYPFAFLSVIEMTAILAHLWPGEKAWIPAVPGDPWSSARGRHLVGTPLAIIAAGAGAFPVVNYFFLGNAYVHEVMVICVVPCAFLFDVIALAGGQRSVIGAALSGRYREVMIVAVAVLLSAVLHEIPNTFAWEWVYRNFPFTSLEIFKVHVLVYCPGWLFLVLFPLSLYAYLGNWFGVSHPLWRCLSKSSQ
jgi:hypothetical protein